MSASVLRVKDVMQMLDCSQSQAYIVMRRLNDELKQQGYITIAGRIPKSYFEKRCLLNEAK